MPFTSAGATRMFDALLVGSLWVHLHTDEPVTSANVITGIGYAGVQIMGGFLAETAVGLRRRTNGGLIRFPTPGGAWPTAAAIGIWDRHNIAPNPADPPGLLRSARLAEPVTGALNDAITIEIRDIDIEIEVTD